jgi:GT2 family glycosyltransferase
MPADPRISVVMPTLDRPETLARSLDALAQQTVSSSAFELVLVADARSVTAPQPGARPFELRLLQATQPGASAARNAGWRAARAPVVLFIGDDIIAAPQLLAEHLDWHEREPADEVGVLGSVAWARELRRDAFMTWLDAGIQFDYGTIKGREAGAGHFYTANVSLKRSMLDRAGGFDEERFPFLYEDIDLGVRLFEHGFRLLYNRAARAEHLHQPSVGQWQQRMRLVAAAERRWVEKRPEQAPYFHGLFADAASKPPARGRGRHLVRLIPRTTPWLGAKVWASADLYFRQQLAEAFMSAWEGPERIST